MKKSFFTDVSITYISQFLSAILIVLLVKVSAYNLDEEEFGLFLIVRRIISFSFPIITLKLGISLARFVSSSYQRSNYYLSFSFTAITLIFFIVSLIVILGRSVVTSFVFGSSEYSYLVIPLLLYLYSYSVQNLFQGYFRGKLDVFNMNAIVLAFNATAFLCSTIFCFVIVRPNYYFYIITALLSFIISMLFIWKTVKVKILKTFSKKLLLSPIDKEFVMFGINRLPSGFFFQGVLFIPVLVATNWLSLISAGQVGIIITVISLMQLIGTPLNLLFLPKFARYQSELDSIDLIKKVQHVLDFVISLPLLIGLYVYLFSPEIINIWFGYKYSIMIKELMLISPAIGFLLIFVLLRGILDGLSHFPYINIITFLGLSSMGVSILISIFSGLTVHSLIVSLAVGIIILGLSSIFILKYILPVKIFTMRNTVSVVLIVVYYFLSHTIHAITLQYSIIFSLLIKSVFAVIVLLFTLFVYTILKYSWVNYLMRK